MSLKSLAEIKIKKKKDYMSGLKVRLVYSGNALKRMLFLNKRKKVYHLAPIQLVSL